MRGLEGCGQEFEVKASPLAAVACFLGAAGSDTVASVEPGVVICGVLRNWGLDMSPGHYTEITFWTLIVFLSQMILTS